MSCGIDWAVIQNISVMSLSNVCRKVRLGFYDIFLIHLNGIDRHCMFKGSARVGTCNSESVL